MPSRRIANVAVIVSLTPLFSYPIQWVSMVDGLAMIDERNFDIIHLTGQLESLSSCSSLFTSRATYILLAVES